MRPRTLMSVRQTILVTGAGGSIGTALAKMLIESHLHELILLDHSVHNLSRIQAELSAMPEYANFIPIIVDVCDSARIAEVIERYQPDIILHSAALKHVPLMETDPLGAIRVNALGTFTLASAAVEYETPKLVMISTDKAVNPQSVMGASKRIAELVLTRLNSSLTQMKAIRLGNVWGSEGSVVPLFQEQISRGGPVTVTDPDATRYFLAMNQAVELVLAMASLDDEGSIFLPVMEKAVRILDVARRLVEEVGLRLDIDIPTVITGLRPGDKMTEELVSENESLESTRDPRLHRVRNSRSLPDAFDALISELTDSVSNRDTVPVLEILSSLVPEYHPSDFVLESLARSAA
jgi:FlaA1/EpsC-like NDP-sugar epimerase